MNWFKYEALANDESYTNPISFDAIRITIENKGIPVLTCKTFFAGLLHFVSDTYVIVVNEDLRDQYKAFYNSALFLHACFKFPHEKDDPVIYLSDLDHNDPFLVTAAAMIYPYDSLPKNSKEIRECLLRGFDPVLLTFRLLTMRQMDNVYPLLDRLTSNTIPVQRRIYP